MGRRSRRRGEVATPPLATYGDGPEPGHPRPTYEGPIIAVGAPVAERAWILPRWFECLAAQTVQPGCFCFVYSASQDATYLELQRGANSIMDIGRPGALTIAKTKLPFYPRLGPDGRNGDATDPCRAKHFSELRNQLRAAFLSTPADVFFSLDTDILLEDKTVIERLLHTLYGPRLQNPRAEWGWDVVAPRTVLHPRESSACFNAGYWTSTDLGSFDQGFRRAGDYEAGCEPPVKIDVPMAAVMMHRHAMGMSRYKPHELGEDMGFAQSLGEHKFRTGWCTDVLGRHVWDEWALAPSNLDPV